MNGFISHALFGLAKLATLPCFRLAALRATRPMRAFVLVLASLLGAGAVLAQETPLGPGDNIKVTVYQNPDLNSEHRISQTGNITFPLVGAVNLGGLTIPQAQDRIAKSLKDGGFVLKPQVSVSLTEIRSVQVSILGQVGKPGRYPIEIGNSKVSDMIAAAGGVGPLGADIVTLVGTRQGKPLKVDIDLPMIYQSGRNDLDTTVAGGDIIYVQRAPSFYIYGEVQKPGVFRLERGTTLLQALAQSGGLTQRGTEKGLRLHRRDANNQVKILEPKMNDPILPDDVIYIRESVF